MSFKMKTITYKTLENLVAHGFSIQDIALKLGVSKGSVEYWLKKWGLRTIYDNRPKRERPTLDLLDEEAQAYVDITYLTILDQKQKKARRVNVQALHVILGSKTYTALMEVTQDTARIEEALRQLLNRFNLTLDKLKIAVDSEFAFLKLFGYDVGKAASWNPRRQLNKKWFGVKSKVYQYLNFLKTVYGLTNEDLLRNMELVVNTYKYVLSLPVSSDKWHIIDLRKTQLQEQTTQVGQSIPNMPH